MKNTSDKAGEDVVELYTHQRSGSASRPTRELKGFARVKLAAGETRTVRLHVSAEDLSSWSPATHRRATEAATYDLWIGDSVAASDHAQFDVTSTIAQR